MSYTEALKYLDSFVNYERIWPPRHPVRWNLDRIRHLLRLLGNPQDSFVSVHIAGTRGKGSAAAFLHSILCEAGLRTGLFTSPHLVSFRERVQVDRNLISPRSVVTLVEQIKPAVERTKEEWPQTPPTFFEVYTALAFLHFARRRVDIAIVETGLGGRLDATNVLNPAVCVITRIGLDHTWLLGDTIPEIAREKAGIIKKGSLAITCAQEPEAWAELRERFDETGVPAYAAVERGRKAPGKVSGRITFISRSSGLDGQVFDISGLRGEYLGLSCPLLGRFQAQNAAIAVGAAELLAQQGVAVDGACIRAGIGKVQWPGRLQVMRRAPFLIFDAAHDELSARAIAAEIRHLFPGRQLTLVLGMFGDKNAEAVARALCPLSKEVVCTAAALPRAMPPEELAAAIRRFSRKVEVVPRVASALRAAVKRAKPDEVVLVTGSVCLIGEAMQALRRLRSLKPEI